MRALEAIPQAVQTADYKRSVHLLPQDVDDDVLFDSYLRAAQEVVEAGTRRPMSPRSVEFQERLIGSARWWFPVCPVIALTSVSYTGADGAEVPLDLYDIRLEMPHNEPQLVFAPGLWDAAPAGAVVTVVADVGHGVDTMPRQLFEATTLIVKDWYEAKIAVEEKKHLQTSFGCRALMRQVKYSRPRVLSGDA